MSDLIERLHDCKRGLSTATPDDYNKWWREMTRLQAELKQANAVVEILERLEGEARHVYGVMDHSGSADRINFGGMEAVFEDLRQFRAALKTDDDRVWRDK